MTDSVLNGVDDESFPPRFELARRLGHCLEFLEVQVFPGCQLSSRLGPDRLGFCKDDPISVWKLLLLRLSCWQLYKTTSER